MTQDHNTLDIITLRRMLDLTQDQLAHALKVSPRTVRRWEQGATVHLIWQDRLTKIFRAKFPESEPPRLPHVKVSE